MLGLGILKLQAAKKVDEVVVSTESELIARVAYDFGATVLERPAELAQDDVPSIPVFQHLVQHFPCDVHVNLNINFPTCHPEVIDRAVDFALEWGEALSDPVAVWSQTPHCLETYPDPWDITARKFKDDRAGDLDVHTEEDLLDTYRVFQDRKSPWAGKTVVKNRAEVAADL